ncbi:MAG TPA: zf-TFIIB domain-containing protein [Candidatus Moranbacteria bacterium]|nr:zf-TFIIB domain-containing protein [Candidatus Moranbacteria bacterium]
MKCPIDNTDLQMTDRQGIEMDYCPKCRGIWLDRGELDKIIERSAANTHPDFQERRRTDFIDNHDDHGYGYGRHKKRKGLLGELFDF